MSKAIEDVVCEQLKAIVAELEAKASAASSKAAAPEVALSAKDLLHLRDSKINRMRAVMDAANSLRIIYGWLDADGRERYDAKGSVRDFIEGIQAWLVEGVRSIEKQLGF